MTVTKNLGHRYLWVDELCIDQENASHRNSQLGKMDQIYKGADLTIVAACGNNKNYGLPGVDLTTRIEHPVLQLESNEAKISSIGPEPMKALTSSTWFDRAW